MSSFRNRRGTRSGQTAGKAMAGEGGAERPFNEALGRAMGLLAQREHGRAELQSKLIAKGVEADVAAGVVAKLRADGLQSEVRFAAALVRRRIARGYGPVYIRGELRERRVDDDAADAEMNQTDEFWLQRAMDALSRKFPPGKGCDTPYNTRARFLARRGFPADIVYRTLHAGREYA